MFQGRSRARNSEGQPGGDLSLPRSFGWIPGDSSETTGKESNELFTPHPRRNLKHSEYSLPELVDHQLRISAFQRDLSTGHRSVPARRALIPDDRLHQFFGPAGRALRSHR